VREHPEQQVVLKDADAVRAAQVTAAALPGGSTGVPAAAL